MPDHFRKALIPSVGNGGTGLSRTGSSSLLRQPTVLATCLGLAVSALLAVPGAAATTGITATCTSGGSTGPCSTGWYQADVTVSFILPGGASNPQGCGNQLVTADTAGTTFTCTVVVQGSQCCRLDVPIKRDATPPTASIALARGPDVNGWYNHAVGATVSGSDATSGIASCTTPTYAGPDSATAAVTGTCTDNAGNVSAPASAAIEYDSSPPSVAAVPARGADANGWYNHPVDVAFAGSDGASGIAGCTSATYAGPDAGAASVGGSCTDQAGNVGTASFALKYDATAPVVSGATPDRAPDANGFYNHAVTVTFAGTDTTSGVATCDTPTYDKPDDAAAKVTGTCVDNAGNTSAPSAFALKYDSTPPKLAALTAAAQNQRVSLAWKPSADVASITVTRTGGNAAPKTVYSGKRISAFVDTSLRNGSRYAYTVVAVDLAGNEVTMRAAAEPDAPLVSPRNGAHVRGAVTLRWHPAVDTRYYNLQLWYRGTKVLSTWPSATSLRLPRSWTYDGRAYTLVPGRYTWYVWPGVGKKQANRFGALLGSSSFVIGR